MAYDIVQTVLALGNTVSSPTTVTFNVSPKQGNLIVLGVAFFNTGTAITVTDGQGNIYTERASLASGSDGGLMKIYTAISFGGVAPNVITISWATAARVVAYAVEYRGPVAALFDSSASQDTPAGSSVSYALVNGSAQDLVVTINARSGGGVTWSGLSGTDRSGTIGPQFEFNDILSAAVGSNTITATSTGVSFASLSASFRSAPIEPSSTVSSQTVVELLAELDDELHGRKSAFAEAQKIRQLNKAINALWKIFKVLHRGYFVVSSQRDTVGADDYFGDIDTVILEYALPKNFAEMRFIEVLSPTDYAGLEFVRTSMNAELFGAERRSNNADSSASSTVAIPGQMNYDITGPDAAGLQKMILSRAARIVLQVKLWYARTVPRFSVPKVATEALSSMMATYNHELVTYAAKSLLKSEESDAADFVKWEAVWRADIERAVQAADERSTADFDVVEGFIEL